MDFKITGRLLTDVLEESGYHIDFVEHRSASNLQKACFFDEGHDVFDSWNLYIPLTDKPLPLHRFFGELTFVTALYYDPMEVPANISLLMIEDASLCGEIYTKILDTFDFFHCWELKLKIAVAKRDFQKIAELGMDALQNPLFVHDIHYNYVLWTKRLEGQTVPTVNFRTGIVTTPMDELPALTSSPAYKATIGRKGAHIYFNYDIDKYRVLYVNLWDKNKEYIGRLCVDEMATPILPSHYQIAEYYASQLEELMEKQETAIPSIHERFKEFLRLVMRQKIFQSDEHAQQLDDILWKKEDLYQMFCFCFEPEYHQLPSKENICYELEVTISEGCAFVEQGYIWFLVNMERGKHTEKELREIIAGRFQNIPVHIGISNPFSQFWDLCYAASQAEYAVKANGSQPFSKLVLYPFSRNAASVILAYGKNCLPLHFILSPALSLLKDYDRQNQSDFLYTLRVFLECERNMAEAAAKLFIHRTTMSYRISRIEKITGIDLNNYDERLYLQISLRLMDASA